MAPELTKVDPPKQGLTEEQKANLSKGVIGATAPDDLSAAEIEAAMEAEAGKKPDEVTTPVEDPPKKDPPPADTGIPNLSADEYSVLRERAEAMAAIEQHPDMITAIIQELKSRQGDASPSIETDTKTEQSGETGVKMDRLENMMHQVLQRLDMSEQRDTVDGWAELRPVVEAIRQKHPSMSIQDATEFAKDKLTASGKEVGRATAPLQTSEVSTSAAPKSDSDKSHAELLAEATKRVLEPKSTGDAIEVAFREALKLEKLKEQRQGA